jgi:hypothetical protein
MCDPPGCVEADGARADEFRQAALDGGELIGADLPLPPGAQLVEDGFALAHDLEAERRDPQALAAGVPGVGVAGDVAAVLQRGTDIDEFSRGYARPDGWRGAPGLYRSMLRKARRSGSSPNHPA